MGVPAQQVADAGRAGELLVMVPRPLPRSDEPHRHIAQLRQRPAHRLTPKAKRSATAPETLVDARVIDAAVIQ
jgi:hypothetical protein